MERSIIGILDYFQNLLDKTRAVDFLAPQALRLYLVPLFWMGGTHNLNNAGLDCMSNDAGGCTSAPKQDINNRFGNPDCDLACRFLN